MQAIYLVAPFLEISTAIGCPVDCTFCPQQAARDAYTGPRLMPFATFAACLAKMPPGTEVSFAGFAEPWLNPAATDMAEECHRRGTQWETYTTCVGMTEADVDRIVEAQPIRIKLHLPDEEGYAKIRITDNYVSVVNRLADKFPVNVMTMGTLPEVFRRRWGKLKAAFMHTRAGNVTVKIAPPRKTGPLKCRPGPELDRNILLPDGSLTVCCMDFGQQHVIGNLLAETWEQIRSGPGLASLREAMASQDGVCLCRTCELAVPAGEKIKCV